ncbi:trace amine-associated receptor 1-like [Archocentrus centrarchus]|uniref:trace amine-associated receptor 1-like n=1 Tax=Archocentrus centrarchus TaxID=63155 RepID=UPI0011EA09C5|nr:trace amine-associated receptor 1-like [Archocentrus centrarchus]
MESFNRTNDTMSWLLCETEKNKLCVLLYVFLLSLMAIIICGNLLVIISVIYFKQLHTPTNYLILSLAVADLLIGVLIFPFSMTFSYIQCLSAYTLLCNIRSTCDITISIASILNLCCISVDRYYAVCHPLVYKTKITDSVAMKMGLGSWTVAIMTGIWYFLMFFIQYECDTGCNSTLVILSIIIYYTPTTILVCMYCKILSVALSQARSVQNKTKSGAVASKERKATKTLTIVVGLFLICWAPLIFSYPLYPLSTVIFEALLEPLNWFSLSNSMLNPFIYAFFYSWFRSAFKMIISGKIFQGDVSNTKLY